MKVDPENRCTPAFSKAASTALRNDAPCIALVLLENMDEVRSVLVTNTDFHLEQHWLLKQMMLLLLIKSLDEVRSMLVTNTDFHLEQHWLLR